MTRIEAETSKLDPSCAISVTRMRPASRRWGCGHHEADPRRGQCASAVIAGHVIVLSLSDEERKTIRGMDIGSVRATGEQIERSEVVINRSWNRLRRGCY